MTDSDSAAFRDDPKDGPGLRQSAARCLSGALEGLVLVLVVLSPWAFGAVDPGYEALLYGGVGLLLALWAARLLLEGRVVWRRCPLAVGLAALFVGGACQLIPLPEPILARLSPATARLYGRLLPQPPERLPAGAVRDAAAPPAGSTLSLYPQATRRQVLQLLGVFLVFVVVRNSVASAASLRRLSRAALGNGTLLALFGLIQSFTAPANRIYWTYPSDGQGFGPFADRNHFASYMNLCVGLGTGLLLSHLYSAGQGRTESVPLYNRKVLGVGAALAVMLGGVAFCLSWGSLLALFGGVIVCLAIQLSRTRRQLGPGPVLLILSLALAAAAWLGRDRIEALATAGRQGEAGQDAGSLSWSRSLPLVKDFPVWGTGYGTFAHAQSLLGGKPVEGGSVSLGGRNGYLEALVEGGGTCLALGVLAIGLVYWLGYRAFSRRADEPAGGLVLGALFSFTTLVVQSFLHSGLHVPAVALLATVLCAQLSTLGGREARPDTGGTDQFCVRLWGLAPLTVAVTAMLLGVVLMIEGWKEYRANRLQVAASRLDQTWDPASRARQIGSLETAVRLAPRDCHLHMELAQAQARFFDERLESTREGGRFFEAAQAVLAVAPLRAPAGPGRPAWAPQPFWLTAPFAWQQLVAARERQLTQQHLVPALRSTVRARDACPLWAVPHLWLADHADLLEEAEPRRAYRERAKLVAPGDAGLWYRCGAQELDDGQPNEAQKDWRRSLELSDLYLPAILDRSADLFDSGDILERVLPDRPGLLLAAAEYLYPEPKEVAERRPFLEKARAALERQPGPRKPADFHTEALIHRSLGHPDEALAAYREAIAADPGQAAWRYEGAKLLHEQGRLQEARQDLLTVLERQPGNTRARKLLEKIASQLGEKE